MASTIPRHFTELDAQEEWSFSECTNQQTGYITHCYHRYPAKFIPQVAHRLIVDHSEQGDVVLDPFMGSGTTPVEALTLGRNARGIDINPAAVIAGRAKTRAIEPGRMARGLRQIEARLAYLIDPEKGGLPFEAPDPIVPSNQERLDFWFPRDQQVRLGVLLAIIEETPDEEVRDFLRCAFSHTLKTNSYWLMKSSKPTRDRKKMEQGLRAPAIAFRRHLAKMCRANERFWALMAEAHGSDVTFSADIRRGDSRNLPWDDDSVDLVATSPPYVTSYEYADLHQLTTLWLGGVADLAASKEEFIGSAAARGRNVEAAQSERGSDIVQRLGRLRKSKGEEVRQYFLDMQSVFAELHRVLRQGGLVCNVIGNTTLCGVEILNAEVHTEIMENLGFELVDVIKRVIPSKTLPQVRDPKTGKFTSENGKGTVDAYPEEFIVIMRK